MFPRSPFLSAKDFAFRELGKTTGEALNIENDYVVLAISVASGAARGMEAI